MSDSSSRASSASLEPEPAPEAPVSSVEGAEDNLLLRVAPTFKAPSGFIKASYHADAASEFDLDDVEGDDCELWLIRAPDNIKIKHLDGLTVPEVGSSTLFTARKQQLSLGDVKSRADMESMTAFLPRRSGDNKLYKSSKGFARRLAVTVADTTDMSVDNVEGLPPSVEQQHKQPKFRYIYEATGSTTVSRPEVSEEHRPVKKRKKA